MTVVMNPHSMSRSGGDSSGVGGGDDDDDDKSESSEGKYTAQTVLATVIIYTVIYCRFCSKC